VLVTSLKEATESAFNWVKTNVTESAEDIAGFFQDVGAYTKTIAEGLVNFCDTSAEDAVTYLKLGAEEAAALLKNTFNRSVSEVGTYLKSVGGYSEDVTKAALESAGYAVDEVETWIDSAKTVVNGIWKWLT
jgi:hypothetical protein